MSGTLEGLEVVMNMIDNILVFRITQEEHDRRLCQVMQRLQDAGIKLHRVERVFSAREVKFLGVVVGAKSIRPDSEEIRTLMDLEAPPMSAEYTGYWECRIT